MIHSHRWPLNKTSSLLGKRKWRKWEVIEFAVDTTAGELSSGHHNEWRNPTRDPCRVIAWIRQLRDIGRDTKEGIWLGDEALQDEWKCCDVQIDWHTLIFECAPPFSAWVSGWGWTIYSSLFFPLVSGNVYHTNCLTFKTPLTYLTRGVSHFGDQMTKATFSRREIVRSKKTFHDYAYLTHRCIYEHI